MAIFGNGHIWHRIKCESTKSPNVVVEALLEPVFLKILLSDVSHGEATGEYSNTWHLCERSVEVFTLGNLNNSKQSVPTPILSRVLHTLTTVSAGLAMARLGNSQHKKTHDMYLAHQLLLATTLPAHYYVNTPDPKYTTDFKILRSSRFSWGAPWARKVWPPKVQLPFTVARVSHSFIRQVQSSFKPRIWTNTLDSPSQHNTQCTVMRRKRNKDIKWSR